MLETQNLWDIFLEFSVWIIFHIRHNLIWPCETSHLKFSINELSFHQSLALSLYSSSGMMVRRFSPYKFSFYVIIVKKFFSSILIFLVYFHRFTHVYLFAVFYSVRRLIRFYFYTDTQKPESREWEGERLGTKSIHVNLIPSFNVSPFAFLFFIFSVYHSSEILCVFLLCLTVFSISLLFCLLASLS